MIKNLSKLFCIVMFIFAILPHSFAATPDYWPGYGRIAISSDGNKHDNDDMQATMMALMILAKAGLQNETVLYTYADHVWGSEDNDLQIMKESAEDGGQKFGFTSTNFIPAVTYTDSAYNEMAKAIASSTARSPLFIIAAGPMQVVGSGLELANATNPEALNHVTVISHSWWNNTHADNPEGSGSVHGEEVPHTGWTWAEMESAFGSKVNFNYISDQNGTGDNPYITKDKFSAPNWDSWSWMNTHADPNVNWVYTKGVSNPAGPDYSDAGMAYYFCANKGDEFGNPTKLKDWVGAANIVIVDTTDNKEIEGPVNCIQIMSADFDKYTNMGVGFSDADLAAVPNVPTGSANVGTEVLSCPAPAGIPGTSVGWSAAEEIYTGPAIKAVFRMNTMLESDGECTYKVFVNDVLVGEVTNPMNQHGESGALPEYSIYSQIVDTVGTDISHGDTIRIEFNNISNKLHVEGAGHATARGRWESIEICSKDDSPITCDGATGAFIEKDGILIIEAESAADYELKGFKLYNKVVGSTSPTGDGFLRYEGPDNMGSQNAANTLSYKIQINNPGEYNFVWRNVRDPNATTGDASNDSWLFIKGDGCSFYGRLATDPISLSLPTKMWVQKSEFVYECYGETHEHGAVQNGMAIFANFDKAGEYTIEFGGRSNGHSVDRIVLYKTEKKNLAIHIDSPESGRADCDLNKEYPTILTPEIPNENPNPSPTEGSVITIEAETFVTTGGTFDDATCCSGPGFGVNRTDTDINFVNTGDYIEYTVNIPKTDNYYIVYYLSTPSTGATIEFYDGDTRLNTTTVPNNNSWDSYYGLYVQETVSLTEGQHTIKIKAGGNDWAWNLDKFTLQEDVNGSYNSIDYAKKELLNVAPNPFTYNITIYSGEEMKTIVLYQHDGKVVKTLENVNSNEENLDTSDLKMGMYILRVQTQENGWIVSKVMKQ